MEPLHQLVHWTEVVLNLPPGVLVHAQLHPCRLAAVHEALDLAQIAQWSVVVRGRVLLLQARGETLGHLEAAVQDLLVLVFKPEARHLGEVKMKVSLKETE